MAGIFGQSQVQEPGATVQPVAPVTDESAVVAARGLAGVATTGLQLFTGAMQEKAASAQLGSIKSYQNEQLKIVKAYKQGKIKRPEAEMRWLDNYQNAIVGASDQSTADELLKITSTMAKTSGIGKSIVGESEEEKNWNANVKAASEAGHVRPGMTKEQVYAATNNFLDMKLVTEKMKRDEAAYDLESKKVGLDKSRLELLQARRRETSIANVSTLADKGFPVLQNAMQDIVSRQVSGQITQEEALMEIQQQYSSLDRTVKTAGAAAGGEYLNSIIQPMQDMRKYTEDLILGKLSTEAYKAQVENRMAMQTFSMMKDPELLRLAVTQSIFKNSDIFTIAQLGSKLLETSNNATDTKTKPFDPTPDTPEGKRVFNGFMTMAKQSMSKLVDGSAIEPEKLQEELGAITINMLKGVDAYSNAVTNPSEYNQIVDFLASDEFGKYATKYGVPEDVAASAKAVFKQQYDEVAFNVIRNEYEKETLYLMNQFDPRVIVGGNKAAPATELIEPVFSGNAVVFRLKEGVKPTVYSRTTLKKLNDKAGKLINRLVRLDAHLSGKTSYKASFDEIYPRIFGEDKEEKEGNVEDSK